MAVIIENKNLGDGMYLMKTNCTKKSSPGQFYMVRGWDKYPLLSRPISIFDWDGMTTSFLYRVVGEGTEILSKMTKGMEVVLHGPYGNGFPDINEDTVTLIGGGIGTAPLYHTAKELKKRDPNKNIKLYLGFENKSDAAKEFESLDAEVIVRYGGYITDYVDYENAGTILTCGPEIMMKAAFERSKPYESKVYVSMEKRMACGVGACLGCTCKTEGGNKRTCKEGPVFEGGEVFFE